MEKRDVTGGSVVTGFAQGVKCLLSSVLWSKVKFYPLVSSNRQYCVVQRLVLHSLLEMVLFTGYCRHRMPALSYLANPKPTVLGPECD